MAQKPVTDPSGDTLKRNGNSDDFEGPPKKKILTEEKAPSLLPQHVRRNPGFSELKDEHLLFFKSILKPEDLIVDDSRLAVMNTDWTKYFRGNSKLALQPRTTEQVSAILKYCNDNKLALVPQGGRTGLVGGGVPVFDEIILLGTGMKKIISLDELSGILVCEAGCTVAELDNFLYDKGFMMPYNLGPRRSCQIGANVSVNAGGHRFVRYGGLHGNVLGLEVVLANGTVLDSLSELRKDNTGYDLKQLFIGGEGTLGFITKVSISVVRRPKVKKTALLGLRDFDKVLKTLVKVRSDVAEILSAVEFMDRSAVAVVLKNFPGEAVNYLSKQYDQYMLIETSGSHDIHDQAKMELFVNEAMSEKLIEEYFIAENVEQASKIWFNRLKITRSLALNGNTYKYDLSLPVKNMYDVPTGLQKHLGDRGEVVSFGHLGDGNLHMTVSTPGKEFSADLKKVIDDYVYPECGKLKGSISAEHGLGLLKAHKIHYSKSSGIVEMMKQIKTLFDPNGILNPYKTIVME